MVTLPSDLQLTVATSDPLLSNFQKLVFSEYGRRGWLNTEDYPSQKVTDSFDRHSHSIVFHKEDTALAGMRIVSDSEFGFPHEEHLDLSSLLNNNSLSSEFKDLLIRTPRSRMAEITKVVSQVGHKPLFFNITKSLYWYAQFCEIDVFLMVIDVNFFKLGNLIGMPIFPIGKNIHCEGSETIPAITIPSLYPKLLTHKSWGWPYIQDTSNLDPSWTSLVTPNSELAPLSVF